tara:strand:+ start:256 stop:537 length:282 start_codon:yes stop_codon:yes gene_type:complete
MTIRELLSKIEIVFNDFIAWFGDGASKLIELRFLDFTIGQAIFTILLLILCFSARGWESEEADVKRTDPDLRAMLIGTVLIIILISIAYGIQR